MKKTRFFKNHDRSKYIFQNRALFLGLLMLVCGLFLWVRLFYLQVFQHTVYQTLSWRNQVTLKPLSPNRGLILDRNGVIIADNTPIYNLMLTPQQTVNIENSMESLKKLMPISSEDMQQFYKLRKENPHLVEIPIKTNLTEEEVSLFMVNQYRYPGININIQLARFYPYGEATAHLLGYVGRIDLKDEENINKESYKGTDYIGKIGIEKFYEDRLHGIAGFEAIETDASGHAIRILKEEPLKPGKNLILTVDIGLQLEAIRALDQHRGAIVAIDPNNGEILALVSHPGFDPNMMSRGVNKTLYRQWRDSPEQPLYNRAIRGQYPLASTIKPFAALGALALNVINPKDTIFDPGWYRLPMASHIYRDYRKDGHGIVNLPRAITVSCDTYFYQLGVKLGITRLGKILQSFGFGDSTFIDMHEELPGLVPTPEWKKKHTHQIWYLGDTVSAAIGQGYMLTTPLQLANATAILATQGTTYQPHLMRGIVDGQKVIEFVKLPGSQVVHASDKNWDLIHQAMKNVVMSPEGTAYSRYGKVAYSVAGKTGTAQVFNLKNRDRSIPQERLPEFLRDHSLFIAFAPVEKPIIALAVVIENNKRMAPIVARQIIDYHLMTHGIIPKPMDPPVMKLLKNQTAPAAVKNDKKNFNRNRKGRRFRDRGIECSLIKDFTLLFYLFDALSKEKLSRLLDPSDKPKEDGAWR